MSIAVRGRMSMQLGHSPDDSIEAFVPQEPQVFHSNLFLTEGYNLLAEIVGGNFVDAQVAYIDIGNWGDYRNGIDVGARVAEDLTDTGVRNSIFRKAVLDFSYTANLAVFRTILRPYEGNTAGETPPYINEFALLSADLRAFSHIVLPESAGLGTPAVQKTKTAGLHALLVYELEFLPA